MAPGLIDAAVERNRNRIYIFFIFTRLILISRDATFLATDYVISHDEFCRLIIEERRPFPKTDIKKYKNISNNKAICD